MNTDVWANQSFQTINQKRGRPLECFVEGSVIVGNTLFVTDIPYGRIFAVDLASKVWRVIVEYDGELNDSTKGLLELDLDTTRVTFILTRFNGEGSNHLNDVIVNSRKDIIFTNQGMSGLQCTSGRVSRLDPVGRLDVLLRNGLSPNGLVLDDFEYTLFNAMTRDNSGWHVSLYPDGSIQRPCRFSTYFVMGGPDGMATDIAGDIFAAHSSLGCVFVHRGNGEPFARIDNTSHQGITNLCWGGSDGITIYMTESQDEVVLQVEWHYPGFLSGKAANIVNFH